MPSDDAIEWDDERGPVLTLADGRHVRLRLQHVDDGVRDLRFAGRRDEHTAKFGGPTCTTQPAGPNLRLQIETVAEQPALPDGGRQPDRMDVECPHCGHEFETHAVGDIAACPECDETFPRFQNEATDGGPHGVTIPAPGPISTDDGFVSESDTEGEDGE